MALDFDLARAFTAGSLWQDPKHIKGGVPFQTPDDIRTAVSLSLADHPFAFHALMAKYCDDAISHEVLQDNLDEFGSLVFLETYPDRGLKGSTHAKITEFAIKVFYSPGVYVAKKEREVDGEAAAFVGVHVNTWDSKYKRHFKRLAAALYELEGTAKTDYYRIQGDD